MIINRNKLYEIWNNEALSEFCLKHNIPIPTHPNERNSIRVLILVKLTEDELKDLCE